MQKRATAAHIAIMLPKGAMRCLRGYFVAKKGYVTSYKDKGLPIRLCRLIWHLLCLAGTQEPVLVPKRTLILGDYKQKTNLSMQKLKTEIKVHKT